MGRLYTDFEKHLQQASCCNVWSDPRSAGLSSFSLRKLTKKKGHDQSRVKLVGIMEDLGMKKVESRWENIFSETGMKSLENLS